MHSRKIVFSLTLLFLFLCHTGSLLANDGRIEEIIYQGTGKGSESVIFFLNGPYLPKAFALKGDNPRVVFDFPDTAPSASVARNIEANGAMVQKIRMGVHKDKTRVVIDLVPPGQYHFKQDFSEKDNVLTIRLYQEEPAQKELTPPAPSAPAKPDKAAKPVSPKAQQPASVTPPAEKAAPAEPVAAPPAAQPSQEKAPAAAQKEAPAPDPLLSNVTFENTSNKGEMVLFKLNGFYPPRVSGEETGTPQVICDFPGTRLGDEVIATQAVHGKYVDMIRVSQLTDPAEQVRVSLELVPNKNYDLQQVFFKEDNLFVIIVNSYDDLEKKTVEQPDAPKQ